MKMKRNVGRDILLGIATGDALGVPVEFVSRDQLSKDPVVSMRGYGTHHQPPGTWSDDSSLTFCLAESLCQGYNLYDLASRFVSWYENAYWTSWNRVFDVGIATSHAIQALKNNTSPTLAGGTTVDSNGNGSLMRILPLVLFLRDKNISERFNFTKEVSSLTHRHIRSVIGCFIYLEYALGLLNGQDKHTALLSAKKIVTDFLRHNTLCAEEELFKYHRLLTPSDSLYEIKPIQEYPENEIASSGYVVHTLEAACWCFLSSENYKDAVLKAVNLGSDTDTTAAVTGGLAGLYYGHEQIPAEWLAVLSRRDDIADLGWRLDQKFSAVS
jgi:ADP-ribosyl-[dinitrogen reductase] hydrolase